MWCTIGKNVTAQPGIASAATLAIKYEYTNASWVYPVATATATAYLSAGDVVRPFLSSAPAGNSARFEVRRVQ